MVPLEQPQSHSKSSRNVIFVTFENEFAPLGGLAAVMRVLPRHMARLTDDAVFTVTPFFKEIARCNRRRWDSIEPTELAFAVPFGADEHEARLFRHVDAEGFATYLIDADEFFNAPCDCGNPPAEDAPCNPYLNPGDPDQLLRDALFFSAAVPKALATLGLTENLLLALQDWQAASVALTAERAPELEGPLCVLTVHNPYDKALTDEQLALIFEGRVLGPTVLTKMIPFLDGPLCTVSENFAVELVEDPLHTEVYASHLQPHFRDRGIAGVDNGLFSDLSFPAEAIAAAREGDLEPVLEEKGRRRAELEEVLRSYQPAEAWGTLDLEGFDGPIFLLFGRDDPRQKGYDVAAAAIRSIPRGKARFVFTPIPGEEGLEGLRFLQDLALARPGEVKVFPFRMAQGYMELQRGSSYMVMCSLYEPFGAATEGYAVGTPVVARATGGLVEQVAPHRVPSLSDAAWRWAEPYHPSDAPPTGFLFREHDLPWEDRVSGWRAIVACAYEPGDRVEQRSGIPLFDAMVGEAAAAFRDAIALYEGDREGYARTIVNGFDMLDAFSWERAVREYQQVYELAESMEAQV